MTVKERAILEHLPIEKVKVYDFLIKHEGIWFDVKSINKTKKTAILITESGDYTVKLNEIDELISHEEYMKR